MHKINQRRQGKLAKGKATEIGQISIESQKTVIISPKLVSVVLASNSIEVEHLHQVEKGQFEALILEELTYQTFMLFVFLCRPVQAQDIDFGRARNLAQA